MIHSKNIVYKGKLLLASFILILLFSSCLQTNNDKTNQQKNMTNIESKNPETLFDPTPFAFSHATSGIGNGKYVFISGQSGGEDLHHHLSEDFRQQVQFALKNLETVLKEYHLKPDDVLKITVLIVDHDQEKLKIWTEEMHKVWKNNKFPASTLIPVPKLALDGMMVEVDAIAFMPM
ncbi:RidA family protein [Chryseobacterium tructae]|uniref:RidA family protein n=2 Tax=Chryseobacterium tructae TaxID=1037380 RepID=A0ABV7XY84_9FLAO|nr:RidA family protein [Chryseobacterium tructae]MDN3692339.1 RidA family protein [Chryseobacterium tructae]